MTITLSSAPLPDDAIGSDVQVIDDFSNPCGILNHHKKRIQLGASTVNRVGVGARMCIDSRATVAPAEALDDPSRTDSCSPVAGISQGCRSEVLV